jgi:calcineurin-like phosphoesterase family protein
MIYFTSDTHFDHKNICTGLSKWEDKSSLRPFETIQEMNETLIDNINSVVDKDDTFFILGDFAFSNNVNRIAQLRDMIKCENVILILGNHDHAINENKKNIQSVFKGVYNMYDLKIEKLKQVGIPRIVLSHYPMIAWNNSGKGSVMLHGHCHGNLKVPCETGRLFDMGVDCNDFKPVSLDDVITKAINTKVVSYDHHTNEN